MTTDLASKDRQYLTDKATEAGKKSHRKAKHGLWATIGGIAAAVVATAILPASLPATLLFVAGSITGILGGAHAGGQYLNEKNMQKVKDEINGDKPLEKLAARSSRFKKILKWADNTQGILAIGALASLAVALLVPPAAPVAWTLYSGLFSGYVAAGLAQTVVRPTEDDVTFLSRSAQYSAESGKLAAKLSADKAPPAQALAPSPAPAFENAANANTPPTAAPDVAAVKKLEPPKP